MKKIAYVALVVVIALSATFMLGPKPPAPALNPEPIVSSVPIKKLDSVVAAKEATIENLKPDNEAKIVWANDSIQKTEYAVVYLHGLTASREEGNPVVSSFIERYGCNAYLARLYGHGIEKPDALVELTPDNYLQSAKEAIAIGKSLGEKLIVMCCSTGGTLAFYLAAHDPDIEAIIAYSPNFDIYDPNSDILSKPWGLQMARLIYGSENDSYEATEEFEKYWQTSYRLEALVTTQVLLDETMTNETFNAIDQPVFIGCYYKDEEHQDKIVSVAAMRRFFDQLSTPDAKKRFVEFPNASRHVITHPLRSKDVEGVIHETYRFAEEVISLKPIS